MGLFDTVSVEVLSADFQTKQLGEGMLTYRLAEDGQLVAPCRVLIAYHGLLHLLGEDGAEFMAVFTHGRWKRLTRSWGRLPTPTAVSGENCSGHAIRGDLILLPGGRRAGARKPARRPARMTAQETAFTVHPPPWPALVSGTIGQIRKLIVPKDRKTALRRGLQVCGIHEHSLFPGLEGLARFVNFAYPP
jgi:hypothetical protein